MASLSISGFLKHPFASEASRFRGSIMKIGIQILSAQRMTSFAMSFVSLWVTTSGKFVSYVVIRGSGIQMLWIYASGVIAMVVDLFSFWDRSVSKFICETICHNRRIVFPTGPKSSSFPSTPIPASLGFDNIAPETFRGLHQYILSRTLPMFNRRSNGMV